MNEFELNEIPLQTKIKYLESETEKNKLIAIDAEEVRKHRKIAKIHSLCVIALAIVEMPALIIIAYKMLGY